MVKTTLLLGPINREHLHDLARRHNIVLHELIGFIFSNGGHEYLACRIQVCPGGRVALGYRGSSLPIASYW
jgi:hypothetical protein